MKILAIETSCDETAVSVLECSGGSNDAHFTVAGDALYSQAHKHAEFGGVYPTLAKREHAANLVPLLDQALTQANATSFDTPYDRTIRDHIQELLKREPSLFEKLMAWAETGGRPAVDAIAVTHGPGLEPALWVGVNFAQALALMYDLPLIAVNHLEGHIVASAARAVEGAKRTYTLVDTSFPVLALLISGGHTELVHAPIWGTYHVLGETRDDAVGEAYDKVARMLGLPYPGGLHISNLAQRGRASAHQKYGKPLATDATLPRPMLRSGDLNFSFSGLKTAVLYMLKKVATVDDHVRMRVATEFEEAVVEVLVEKVRLALTQNPARTFVLGGGVAANPYIRLRLSAMLEEESPNTVPQYPAPGLSTDNAIMIGMAAYLRHARLGPKAFIPKGENPLRAVGQLSLHTEMAPVDTAL